MSLLGTLVNTCLSNNVSKLKPAGESIVLFTLRPLPLLDREQPLFKLASQGLVVFLVAELGMVVNYDLILRMLELTTCRRCIELYFDEHKRRLHRALQHAIATSRFVNGFCSARAYAKFLDFTIRFCQTNCIETAE